MQKGLKNNVHKLKRNSMQELIKQKINNNLYVIHEKSMNKQKQANYRMPSRNLWFPNAEDPKIRSINNKKRIDGTGDFEASE